MQSLPVDMLCYLGSFLSLSDILSFMCTSKKLARVCNSDNFWTTKAISEFGVNTHAKIRYVNQRYLSKIGPSRFPAFNEYLFDFVYSLPPYNIRDDGYLKKIQPDIEVLRLNTQLGNVPSSLLDDPEFDVIAISYHPRLCVDGDIPYPHFDSLEQKISAELQEYMFPYLMKNRPHTQIFDNKFRKFIIEHLFKLGYMCISRFVRKEDVDRYRGLWKEA